MGGGGVFRVLKFCKYLPRFNWLPVVLTVKEHDAESFDETLLKEIPEAQIYKTYSVDLPLFYKKYLKKKRKKGSDTPTAGADRSRGVFNAIKQFVDNFILIPDSRIGWIPFAVYKGFKIWKKDGVDLIFSTGGPWTNHLIGLLLKLLTQLPWVADFRDPWTQNLIFDYPFRLRKTLEEQMEKCVLSKADWIVTATHSIANDLQDKYPGIDREKFVTIRNGFDSDDFSDIKVEKMNGFNITHTGNFYLKQSPKYFLQALRELLDENRVPKINIKVNFVGVLDKRSKEIIRSLRLDSVVRCIGIVPHNRSIQWMCSSDILLLVVSDERTIVTSKVYEYMMANRPILALSGEGEASNLLKRTDMAIIVSSRNVKEIKNAIYNLYLKKQAGRLVVAPNFSFIRKFDRKKLTRQLSTLFDKCINIDT